MSSESIIDTDARRPDELISRPAGEEIKAWGEAGGGYGAYLVK